MHDFCGKKNDKTRFVVLSWKRTGSNLLCGILYNHPEITMHNELFNNVDIFTYYPETRHYGGHGKDKWTVRSRDLFSEEFLNYIWSGKYVGGTEMKENSKAIGFKSFPEHWRDSDNEDTFTTAVMEDRHVKKVILYREDELKVFVSAMRAEMTGHYMTHSYPDNLKLHVDPAKFQVFVNMYRETFYQKYTSPTAERDTFRITYEQLSKQESFDEEVRPLLWRFLGVDESAPAHRLQETVKQSAEDEDLSTVIENYEELEYCFRYTDVRLPSRKTARVSTSLCISRRGYLNDVELGDRTERSWSILLPICSRKTTKSPGVVPSQKPVAKGSRLAELEKLAHHQEEEIYGTSECWERLQNFASSLLRTTTEESRRRTECIVGIDVDDAVFGTSEARNLIQKMIPVDVKFVQVKPVMYGKICRIWNFLASQARNEFIVLLGDDIKLLDLNWQRRIEKRFLKIENRTGLPLGAGCVAMNDITFDGFPTFPVVHRWHIDHFKSLLPRQFINQGGDPYLFELYSRWNAAEFEMSARLENIVGGDDAARYTKHPINWPGLVLNTGLRHLRGYLKDAKPVGICIDVVVPSYRCNNVTILESIVDLRGSVLLNVRFWIVVDNPNKKHIREVQELAKRKNEKRDDGNYFVNVVTYGENRGASYARNTGMNRSTADWILFLDDDVCPKPELLDAYAGAIWRYPKAKVMVGLTVLPDPYNLWTEILAASKITGFYGVAAKHKSHPPWGVTANLLVSGSRFHHTVQFNSLYPKTGGGEDVDFVFQLKNRYSDPNCVVSVPGARVEHPWWNEGKPCYRQIQGWAWGDSICITEWPHKTYLVFPNWLEFTMLLLLYAFIFSLEISKVFNAALVISLIDHAWKSATFYRRSKGDGFLQLLMVSVGAGTVISSQEVTRLAALIMRCSLFSFCRRFDWLDGQDRSHVCKHKLRSGIQCVMYCLVTWYFFFHD